MSAVLLVESNETENIIVLRGSIDKVLNSKRALRYMKDCTTHELINDVLVFKITDSLNKCLDRVENIARISGCELNFSKKITDAIQDYVNEGEQFAAFSSKALEIRNNSCCIEEFKDFKDSLLKNMKNRILYDLQFLSAYHLAFSQNGCNFSVPGAGKTSIVYGAYTYLKNLSSEDIKKVDKILIIGPLNSFGPWEMEYEECFGRRVTSKRLVQMSLEEKKQYLYSDDTAELLLLSYPSILSLVDELKYFLEKHRVMVVLDEAHKIKNTSGGAIAQSILDIAQRCKSRVVLTGTPAPNGYEDLYNLFKFIWPTKEIVKFHIGQLKDMSKNINDPRVMTLLDSIKPYFVRIKKSDLHIPEAINHPPILVGMKTYQRKIYDFIENKYINDIINGKDKKFRNEIVRAKLVRLMQAATNPQLLKQPLIDFAEAEGISFTEIEDDTLILNEIIKYADNEIPAKFEVAKDLIEKIIAKDGKVVVWACYIKSINLFSEYLKDQGIPSKILYGGTPVASDDMNEEDEEYELTREAIIKQFHNSDSDFKVIIANPFAVAESISLHKACHNAIYLERSFNAAHFIQSKDRIHRYGLAEDIQTNYYYLVSSDSIDEVIQERLCEKEKRLLDIIESMPIPLFDNSLLDGGDDDVKAVLRDYARRIKTV